MPFSTLQNELKDIAEELAAIDKLELFGKKLKHRLMGCIEENPELKKEFERRNRIYPDLPSSLAFKALLDSIFAGFKVLHKAIIPQRLTNTENFNNYIHKTGGKKERLGMNDIYEMLATRKAWPVFKVDNQGNGVDVYGEALPPWHSVLRQYEVVRTAVLEMDHLKAIKDSPEVTEAFNKGVSDVAALRDMIEAPLHKWYLHEFEWVEYYGKQPEWIDSLPTIKEAVACVCKELIKHLSTIEDEKKEKRKRKLIRSVLRGIVTTMDGIEYEFTKKESFTAKLCEEVYRNCGKVGDFVGVEHIFNTVWKESYIHNIARNWKRVSGAVDNVNKWCVKMNLPEFLHCSKTEIKRLV